MPKEQLCQVAELRDGEISSEGSLLSFLPNNTDACSEHT